jgi:hypothetical protein
MISEFIVLAELFRYIMNPGTYHYGTLTFPFLIREQLDVVHHLYLPEFKKAYPDAKLIGVEETLHRSEDKTLKFDGGKILYDHCFP